MPRVLVVDDHPLTVELLTARLEAMGLEVDVAATGPTALQRVAAHQPDLVLLDVMMPDMDGFEVTRRLKSNPASAGVKVVLLTALGSSEDEATGRSAGADGYLRKPFQKHELRALVESMLQNGR
ncbi:MAG: response regulator [Bacillota bacterium]